MHLCTLSRMCALSLIKPRAENAGTCECDPGNQEHDATSWPPWQILRLGCILLRGTLGALSHRLGGSTSMPQCALTLVQRCFQIIT